MPEYLSNGIDSLISKKKEKSRGVKKSPFHDCRRMYKNVGTFWPKAHERGGLAIAHLRNEAWQSLIMISVHSSIEKTPGLNDSGYLNEQQMRDDCANNE